MSAFPLRYSAQTMRSPAIAGRTCRAGSEVIGRSTPPTLPVRLRRGGRLRRRLATGSVVVRSQAANVSTSNPSDRKRFILTSRPAEWDRRTDSDLISGKALFPLDTRSYPESGVKTGFHPASHHQEREERILDFAKINRYHVSMVPYLLEKLKNTPDGDSNLLENSLILYGSPMGDSNIHNHKRVPLFLAGHAGGRLKGNLHLKAADGTPMANVMLTLLQGLGLTDIDRFGDSTAALDLNTVSAATRSFT